MDQVSVPSAPCFVRPTWPSCPTNSAPRTTTSSTRGSSASIPATDTDLATYAICSIWYVFSLLMLKCLCRATAVVLWAWSVRMTCSLRWALSPSVPLPVAKLDIRPDSLVSHRSWPGSRPSPELLFRFFEKWMAANEFNTEKFHLTLWFNLFVVLIWLSCQLLVSSR